MGAYMLRLRYLWIALAVVAALTLTGCMRDRGFPFASCDDRKSSAEHLRCIISGPRA